MFTCIWLNPNVFILNMYSDFDYMDYDIHMELWLM